MKVDAILWDFDGTLVDTLHSHFTINQKIFALIKPEVKKDKWPILFSSFKEYQKAEKKSKNWQELYMKHCGFSENQTNAAGNLWSSFQLIDESSIKVFEGISKILKTLNFVPHGICSQNCSIKIKDILKQNKIEQYFKAIIGHKDVAYSKQKPDPEGFISCLNQMELKNYKTIYYIGDHPEDVCFAKNAELFLQKNGVDCRVLTIAVCYNGQDTHDWDIQPDYKAYSANDIVSIIC